MKAPTTPHPISFLWRSLSGRLACFYGAAVFSILFIASLFSYWSLENNLLKVDKQFLEDRVVFLRKALQGDAEDLKELGRSIQGSGSEDPFSRCDVRVASEGKIFMETAGMAGTLPPRSFPKTGPEGESPAQKIQVGQQAFLLLSARATLGPRPQRPAELQLALHLNRQQALLARTRDQLALLLLAGLLLASATGAAIARRGLQPLDAISKSIRRISASQLGERLAPEGWPAELAELAGSFNGMLQRLDDSFQRLSQFSGDLAHELRTPLHNLRLQAEVTLSRAREAGEYRQVLESCLEEYARLSGMIESLLFLARADHTQVPLARASLQARHEVQAMLDFYEVMFAEQGVDLGCQGEAALQADPLLLRRALGNLLSNALKFTPRGGRVEVSIRPAGLGCEISVSDSGTGIEAQDLPKVTERFYKKDPAAATPSQKGAGLGLSIVKSIMDLHHGHLRLESKPGQGTTATLQFPA